MGFFDWLLGTSGATPADDALEGAIRQVMAGTDPRLKAMTGARERLAPAVAHALDYARRISTQQPPHTAMRPENWAASPILRALFAQPDDIARTLNSNADLREFLAGHDGGEDIFCIVAATPVEHTTLGTAMENGVLRRDVERRSVSFRDFRLAGLSPSPETLTARIQDMILEALVLETLGQITASKARSQALEAEHRLLEHRLGLLSQSRAGLNSLHREGDHHQDVELLRRQLADNESALAALRSGSGWLETTLTRLVANLAAAEHCLPIQPVVLWLNAMNIVVAPEDPEATPIPLTEIARPDSSLRLSFPARIARRDVALRQLDLDAALRLL
ncbi:hypothetical protein AZSI13_10520 [Azospira sp. I13]|uniref:hypothetical protein n=1 Tax=Azospira sp. I13 TaxID=1765050 RepID=UPI000D4310C6|nr:hypothetical protein [Azospira sp. I13]GBG01725.1 hypothetical protein AZSI13_10520 [Azospira sp. I13]